MSEPLISVVTPSYNQAEFLERNLESVMEQSVDDVEHIVVDGGSDDGTVGILEEYEDEYDLKWVSESDRGQSHAVNKGLEMASGEWIGWQNSDDFYLDGAIDSVAETIRNRSSIDVIYGDVVYVDQDGAVINRSFKTVPSKFIQRYWSLFASNQSLFLRSEVLNRIGGLNEQLYYTMDAELTWEILSGDYSLYRIGSPIGAFRVQPEAKTYGEVQDEQREELREIYGYPWYDTVVPDRILRRSAQFLKFGYLVREGRIEALTQNVKSRL